MSTFDPTWSFRPLKPGPRQDPFEGELFAGGDAADDDESTDFLVREAVQNALDVRASSDAPVRVRFAVRTGPSALPPADAAPFLAGLAPHLTALNDVLAVGYPTPPMDFVLYEDFGTRGLRGDPMLAKDPAGAEGQDFYWFWWNIGRSGKSGEKLGRWGLGKAVFARASRVRAHLGLTVRADPDRPRLLMGQIATDIHALEPGGPEFEARGYFCHPRASEAELDRPIEDAAWLDRFEHTFGLTRGGEPGLSIVVPYCYETIRALDLLRSALVHWFWPILCGDLIVEVVGPDLPSTTLTATTIRAVADGFD